MLAIEMVGSVYCPLSPRDPQHRLHALLQQTQTRVVLIDRLTRIKFNHDIITLNIDSALTRADATNNFDVDQLSNIVIASRSIAYIIFTSGSTGRPKAVS